MSLVITRGVLRFAVGSRVVRLTLDDKNVAMIRALSARHTYDGEIVVQIGEPGCRKIWFAPVKPVLAAIDDYYAWIAERVEQARMESQNASGVDCRRRRAQSHTVISPRERGTSELGISIGR